MSSHKKLISPSYFSIPLAQFLQKQAFTKENLNFNGFIAVFLTEFEEKRLNQELYSLWEYLTYGGFGVISYNKLESDNLMLKILEKKLLTISNELEKTDFETLSFFLHTPNQNNPFLSQNRSNTKAFIKPKLRTKKNLTKNSIKNEEESLFSSKIEQILYKIQSKLALIPYKTCIIAAFTHKDLTDCLLFKRFLKASSAPKGFNLFYSSKTPMKALLDYQVFFPNAFKFNYISFLVPTPIKPLEKQSFEHSKRLLSIQQDRFKDFAHFNGLILLNEDKEEVASEDFLLKAPHALGKFMKNPGFLVNFFNNEDILMSFSGKFGVCSLMELNSELSPNLYKFTDPFQNQCLLKAFCPKLSNYQRVLVILRPNVLISNLDELIINIYRINQFTIIKRDILKLNESQAYYLARIEKIPEIALKTYISFMLNGPIELILMSHFGAIALSKAISIGFPGKQVKKDPFLKEKELFINEERGSFRTKEILIKKYDNFYDTMRNLSPFNGVQGLLDPIKLIINHKTSENEGILIDEEKKEVFYKEKTTSKKTINHSIEFKKGQLIKELANEGFNFFVFTSEDEVITEELTSMFLGDCSLLSMIQVIIKPNEKDLGLDIINTFIEMGFQIPYR